MAALSARDCSEKRPSVVIVAEQGSGGGGGGAQISVLIERIAFQAQTSLNADEQTRYR